MMPATVESDELAELVQRGEELRARGEWGRALEVQHAALERAEAELGESVGTAGIAQNLAVTHKYTGDFDAAEALYRRALAIAEAADEPTLAAVLCHNLGGLAHARGDYAAGVRWARRGIAIRERADDDAVALAADRGALAGLLLETGDVDEAEQLLLRARRAFVGSLGPDHLEVAIADANLAVVALRRGELTTAERRARSALAAKHASLGTDHPGLATTLTTLGTICRRRGHLEEAVRCHHRALEVLRPAVDPGHPLLVTIEANLAAAEARLALVPGATATSPTAG